VFDLYNIPWSSTFFDDVLDECEFDDDPTDDVRVGA
jgi:hypothetical protein